MAPKKKRKKSSSGSPGCLILLVGLVILAIVFLIKLPDIKGILEKTRFLDLVREKSAKQNEEPVSATGMTSTTLKKAEKESPAPTREPIPPQRCQGQQEPTGPSAETSKGNPATESAGPTSATDDVELPLDRAAFLSHRRRQFPVI
jgi:cytoskeletal protein RodZ